MKTKGRPSWPLVPLSILAALLVLAGSRLRRDGSRLVWQGGGAAGPAVPPPLAAMASATSHQQQQQVGNQQQNQGQHNWQQQDQAEQQQRGQRAERLCDDPPDIPVDGPWDRHCQRLERVCVDQAGIILYVEKYQQVGERKAGDPPVLRVSNKKRYRYPWLAGGGIGSTAARQELDPELDMPEGEPDDGGPERSGAQRQKRARRLAYEVQEPEDYRRRLAPLPLRPVGMLEPRRYLQAPAFSNCTVPVLLAVTWQDNVFHVMENCAVWHALIRRTPWRAHLKPVVVTPEGMALTPIETGLMPALNPSLRLESFADFSNRLPEEAEEGGPAACGSPNSSSKGGGGGSRSHGNPSRTDRSGHTGGGGSKGSGSDGAPQLQAPSWEGGELRCFSRLFFCGERFALQKPPAGASEDAILAALPAGVPRELYSFMQAVVAYHRGMQAQRTQRAQHEGGAAGAAAAGAAGVAGPGLTGAAGGAPLLPPPRASAFAGLDSRGVSKGDEVRKLRVLFIRRDTPGRQLLNVDELVQRCNAWQHTPADGAGAGATWAAECRQVQTPSIEAGIAAAQEADVLIGMHGANLANAWLARPGTSILEVFPYEWADGGEGGLTYSVFDSQDRTSQLLWWVAAVCDPALSTPGPDEAAGRPPERLWPRDRSVTLPWGVLEGVLAEVVAAGGSRQRFMERYRRAKLHRFNVGAVGVLGRGGPCPQLPAEAGGGAGTSQAASSVAASTASAGG